MSAAGHQPFPLYYQRRKWSVEDLIPMRLIDEQHLLTPVYGSRRMAVYLNRMGHRANRKQFRRMTRQMWPQTVNPRPRTSQLGKGHRIYPYRQLRGLKYRPTEPGVSDRHRYVPLARTFMYLVAVLD